MEGPCHSCTVAGEYEVLQKLGSQVEFCRCGNCGRTYLLAELSLDAMCIEAIEQILWKEVSDSPAGDPLGFILDNKPYFASSRGGLFHKVEPGVT